MVTVVSTEAMVALELRNAADRYVELGSMREHLSLSQPFRSQLMEEYREDD